MALQCCVVLLALLWAGHLIAVGCLSLRYYLMKPAEVHEPYHASLMDHALGHEAFTGPEGFLRRRSVQVQCFS